MGNIEHVAAALGPLTCPSRSALIPLPLPPPPNQILKFRVKKTNFSSCILNETDPIDDLFYNFLSQGTTTRHNNPLQKGF